MAVTYINIVNNDDTPMFQFKSDQLYNGYEAVMLTGLIKAYHNDNVLAARLGLRTIYAASFGNASISAGRNLSVGGSTVIRGSNNNSVKIRIGSAGTKYGTFAFLNYNITGLR